MFCNLR